MPGELITCRRALVRFPTSFSKLSLWQWLLLATAVLCEVVVAEYGSLWDADNDCSAGGPCICSDNQVKCSPPVGDKQLKEFPRVPHKMAINVSTM